MTLSATVNPTELYRPIAADLRRVEEVVERELATDVPYLADMVRHIGGFRGKMLRPALVILSGRACGTVTDVHDTLAAVVEIVHVATLVHDDVLDEAEIRRRRATVNQRWGNEAAVLLGDFLISHAYHLCSSLPDVEASRLVGAATNTVCEGELMQVGRRGDFDLSEADYIEIIRRKTACLTGLSARLGAKHAGATPRIAERMYGYGEHLGIAFQIVDDVLDLLGDEKEVGKSLGTDLVKGKLTLPLIHLLRRSHGRKREELEELLRRRPRSNLAEVRRRLAAAESLEYAMGAAEGHVEAALDCLSELPGSSAKDLLTQSAEFVVRRRR
jgi:octaprenyl-diphosphate synthase